MEVDTAEEEKKTQTTTTTPQERESKSKRKMKIASQLELLEKTYAAEVLWAELSGQLGLSDRQLQMWFCHRRLKDRKTPPVKCSRKDSPAAAAATSAGLLPLMTQNVVGKDMVMGAEVGNEHVSGSGSGSSPFGHVVDSRRVGSRAGVAMARIGTDLPPMARIGTDLPPMRRYYEPPQSIIELRAIAFVEAQLGEALREDEPILGMEFDPLPPDAFGAPLGSVGQQKQSGMLYETQVYERPDIKSTKGAARALHEYQFLPEQPTVRPDSYERGAPSKYYGPPADYPSSRVSALSTGHLFIHGIEQIHTGYGSQGHIPSFNLLPQQGRQGHLVSSASGDYDSVPRKNSSTNIGIEAHLGSIQLLQWTMPSYHLRGLSMLRRSFHGSSRGKERYLSHHYNFCTFLP